MSPQEKQEWWRRTVAAIQARDPRVHLALLTALILRHGRIEDGANGVASAQIVERITLEDLMHVVKNYHFGIRSETFGEVSIFVVPKEDVSGDPPGPGQRDPATPGGQDTGGFFS